jgi:hypothetical protein
LKKLIIIREANPQIKKRKNLRIAVCCIALFLTFVPFLILLNVLSVFNRLLFTLSIIIAIILFIQFALDIFLFKTNKMKRLLQIFCENTGLLLKDIDDKHSTLSAKFLVWKDKDSDFIEFFPQGRGIKTDEQVHEFASKLAEVLEDLSTEEWLFKSWIPDGSRGFILEFSHVSDKPIKVTGADFYAKNSTD